MGNWSKIFDRLKYEPLSPGQAALAPTKCILLISEVLYDSGVGRTNALPFMSTTTEADDVDGYSERIAVTVAPMKLLQKMPNVHCWSGMITCYEVI